MVVFLPGKYTASLICIYSGGPLDMEIFSEVMSKIFFRRFASNNNLKPGLCKKSFAACGGRILF